MLPSDKQQEQHGHQEQDYPRLGFAIILLLFIDMDWVKEMLPTQSIVGFVTVKEGGGIAQL